MWSSQLTNSYFPEGLKPVNTEYFYTFLYHRSSIHNWDLLYIPRLLLCIPAPDPMADDSDDDLVSYRMRPQKPIDPTLMATTCAGIVVLLTGGGIGWAAWAEPNWSKWLVKGLKHVEMLFDVLGNQCQGLNFSGWWFISIYPDVYSITPTIVYCLGFKEHESIKSVPVSWQPDASIFSFFGIGWVYNLS